MDEFISVFEDMPLDDPFYKNLTVNVIVKLKDGTTTTAFYDNKNAVWWDYETMKTLQGVVAWKSL